MIPRPALLATLLVAAPVASAQLTTVGFDGVSAPPAFHMIEPGFNNGPHLELNGVTLDGGVILIDLLFDDSATSGDNLLATCDTCELGDTPPTGLPGQISGVFDGPVDHLALDVINGFGGSGATFTLTGRDGGGALLGSSSVSVGPAGNPSGNGHLELSVPGMASFTLTTDLPDGYTFAMDTLVFGDVPGSWTDLGQALAGSLGLPVLTGTGPLLPGSANEVRLGRALPGASAWFVLGFAELQAPFKQGVLVPTPDLVLAGFSVSPGGTVEVPFSWPAGLPAGFELVLQAWIADAVGPAGFAASNALLAAAP